MQYAEILKKISSEQGVGSGARAVVAAPYTKEVMSSLNAVYKNGFLSEILLVGDPKKITGNALSFPVAEYYEPGDIAEKVVEEGKKAGSLIVKGNISSGILLKAVLSGGGGEHIANHVYIIQSRSFPAKTVVVADAGVNISPGLADKAKIIHNVLQVTGAIGLQQPKVAIVCAVEKISSAMTSTQHAAALVEMGQCGDFGEAVINGPMAFDAAMNPEAAATKGLNGPVAGQADVLIFDNIEAANSCAKALIGMEGDAMGVVIWGNTAIAFPSRGDSEKTRYHSLLLATFLSAEAV